MMFLRQHKLSATHFLQSAFMSANQLVLCSGCSGRASIAPRFGSWTTTNKRMTASSPRPGVTYKRERNEKSKQKRQRENESEKMTEVFSLYFISQCHFVGKAINTYYVIHPETDKQWGLVLQTYPKSPVPITSHIIHLWAHDITQTTEKRKASRSEWETGSCLVHVAAYAVHLNREGHLIDI